MPQSIQDAALPGPSRLSISRDTQSTLPASYRPTHRPHPIFTIQRVDIHAIKQELHDALGEDGLPYWKALNGYLLGQLRREELGVMVTGWFKGKKCECPTSSEQSMQWADRQLRVCLQAGTTVSRVHLTACSIV